MDEGVEGGSEKDRALQQLEGILRHVASAELLHDLLYESVDLQIHERVVVFEQHLDPLDDSLHFGEGLIFLYEKLHLFHGCRSGEFLTDVWEDVEQQMIDAH